jgi:hypothetical protein
VNLERRLEKFRYKEKRYWEKMERQRMAGNTFGRKKEHWVLDGEEMVNKWKR